MLSRIGKLGLFSHIHPSISWDEFTRKGLEKLFADHPTKEWIEYLCLDSHKRLIQGAYTVLMMMILPSDIRKVIKRLRFKSDLQKNLIAANQIWYTKTSLSSLSPGEFCQILEKYPPLAVYSNWITEENKDLREKYKRFIYQWRLIYPETTGDDLKRCGIPPGPIYRSILQKLRIARINEEITNIEQEKLLLDKILSKIS